MSTFDTQLHDALEQIKKCSTSNIALSVKELEILLIATLLEEEGNNGSSK